VRPSPRSSVPPQRRQQSLARTMCPTPPHVARSWLTPQCPWSGAIHMWPGQQAPSLTPHQ
jgi:hypothetical protein